MFPTSSLTPSHLGKDDALDIVSSSLGTKEKLLLLRGGSSDDFDWRYFVAGGVCAACSHGITTPLGKRLTFTLWSQ